MNNTFKVKKGLLIEGSGSVVLDIQGNSGQLFSVDDSLIGTLTSVNDISGLPILEVSSDDKVVMGTFGENTLVVSGSKVGVKTTNLTKELNVNGTTQISSDTTINENLHLSTSSLSEGIFGSIPTFDNSSIDGTLQSWNKLQKILYKGVERGKVFTNPIVSTYSLVYTSSGAYWGGVLSPNGDIHFIPTNAPVGQKIDRNGVVSTYSLLANSYQGGVLAPNGDIHFIPTNASVGQKIDINGVVSTYSLGYTVGNAYSGGIISTNGDIHFVPVSAVVGQKVSANGVVSTYSLVYTTSFAYSGGVLSPNGDIHFIPQNANRGQKIDINGVVSTYSLVYTTSSAYFGGVLSPNGDIHFIPTNAPVGQKININGVVSTYSLVYTVGNAYRWGVISANGDIHFVPTAGRVGQKVDINGVVSTYSLAYVPTVNAYRGGVLAPNGDIHFAPINTGVGHIVRNTDGYEFPESVTLSPHFNK
jgi:hypothetical protein